VYSDHAKLCNDYVALLMWKFGVHIVWRTWADSSFQPVSNLTIVIAVLLIFDIDVSGKALMFNFDIISW